jgi:hypothetical protein
VSIDARELAPSDCAKPGYDKTGPNQNLVVFHDRVWPHQRRLPSGEAVEDDFTIALTTVAFDPRTGEIYDADIELNTAHHAIVVSENPKMGTFDLQATLTHEVGHFLGLAHATAPDAAMFADDSGGNSRKRTLSPADIAGICEIYPPNRTRSVSTEVDPTGFVAAGACDPIPRHGLTGACTHDPPKGCSVATARAPKDGASSAAAWLVVLGLIAGGVTVRRRTGARRRAFRSPWRSQSKSRSQSQSPATS